MVILERWLPLPGPRISWQDAIFSSVPFTDPKTTSSSNTIFHHSPIYMRTLPVAMLGHQRFHLRS